MRLGEGADPTTILFIGTEIIDIGLHFSLLLCYKPFLIDSTGGAAENAKGTFGTDLLLGTLLFSGGAVDLALETFFSGESGGVFLGILEVVGLLAGSLGSVVCSAWVDSSTPLSASPSGKKITVKGLVITISKTSFLLSSVS